MSGHSPLGWSGWERWSNCPGSPALIAALPPDTDNKADPEYRRAGTAAHAAWAHCLRHGLDAWEIVTPEWYEWRNMAEADTYRLTAEDLRAGQFYLGVARFRMEALYTEGGPVATLVEYALHAPEIHPLAYGTLDLALISGTTADITDYKHGEGLYVEIEGNGQLRGYAAMLLSAKPWLEHFILRIVQPRLEGAPKVRETVISAAELSHWVDTEARPAMQAASEGKAAALNPGPWCRFCPVKDALACPALDHNLSVVAEVAPIVTKISDERLGDLYAKVEPLEIWIKAVKDETLRRRLLGADIPGTKTVLKQAHRVWKNGAEEALNAALGPCVMTKPKLESPAVVEKLSKLAAQLVREYAFSPDIGYTVALLDDRRKAVEIQPPRADAFDKYLDKPQLID